MMKNRFKRFFAYCCAVILVSAVLPVRAYAGSGTKVDPQETVWITVFDQPAYKAKTAGDKWALAGWASDKSQWRSLYTAGCHIFSYAHALQWVTGTAMGDEILISLMSVCKNPSDKKNSETDIYGNHMGHTAACGGGHSSSRSAYNGFIQGRYSVSTEVDLDESIETMERILGAGGAIITTMGGHYVTAVEYMKGSDGATYVHIVDSSWYSTTESRGYQPYYVKSGNVFYKVNIDGNNCGADFWIRFDTFKGWTWTTAIMPKYTTADSTPRIAISTATESNECRLQSAPYDQSKYHLRNLDRGTIVYIRKRIKNSYGNTWYEIVDANDDYLGYIWEGDLEITESKATFDEDKLVSANLLGVVKTDHGWLKDKPYEASYHGARQVNKGKTVTIVASYSNSHGHLWYKTSDGYFIYSGDVTTYQMETLFTISAVFRNTERRESHTAPYLDSADVSVYKSGAEVTVKRFVKNSHGNIWAELSDGSYLCFYDKDTGENKMQFVRMTSDFKVTGTDGYVPTGKRSVSSCALRGKITGDVPMLYVTARVVNRGTGSTKISVTANMQMGVKTIDINSTAGTSNKVNINNSMPFKQVDTDGYYRYEVAVQLGFTYNGRTFKFGSEQIAIKSDFWIGNPVEDEETLPDIGGTQIGTTTRKPGDVNDDGYVDMLDVIDYMDWYCGGNISINLLNADVTGDGVADMLDIITIMDWYCGGNVDFV